MLKYLAVARILFKEKCHADNFVFFLYYRITFLLFLISSILVTAKEFVGKPMICTSTDVPKNVLNTFCYFTGTYSIPRYYNYTLTNRPESIPYPGVGQGNDIKDQVVRHSYYQWVTFALFLQSFLFYAPHYIWKSVDGGLFATIIGGLNKFSLDEGERAKKHKVLTRYMMDHLNMHKLWSIRFFLCEGLNLIVCIANLYFTNRFLGGTFFDYGTDVLSYSEMDPEHRVDPMTRIFPKMAKCTFRKFGASGTLETHDAFCLLAVNIINEKIYIVLWFWMFFILIITFIWLAFRIATILVRRIRNYLLEFRGRAAGRNNIRILSERLQLGDWFLVYQLGRNMEPIVYGEFLKEFAGELESSLATLERKPMLS